MSEASQGATTASHGGLTVGEIQVAVPLAGLREVVTAASLQPLPGASPLLAGAHEYRGVLLPVIDLHAALGNRKPPARQGLLRIAVLMHERRLIGMLVDEVTGIFTVVPGSHRAAVAGRGSGAVSTGCLRRSDNQVLVWELRPESVAALPGVPLIDDPEPQRLGEVAQAADVEVVPSRSFLLMRSGDVCMAVDTLAVHATLWHPEVSATVFTGGLCRGVVSFAGQRIAVVDLAAMVGLGELPSLDRAQGFVVRVGESFVGFLVERITEIVPVLPERVRALPKVALVHMPLVQAILTGLTAPGGAPASHGRDPLVLDLAAMIARDDVLALSRTAIADGGSSQVATSGTAVDNQGRRPLVVFELEREYAVPIETLHGMLPLATGPGDFGPADPLRRILIDRDRSIPVFSLAMLLGAGGPADETCAMLIRCGEEWVGFATPMPRSIITPRDVVEPPASARRDGLIKLAILGSHDQPRTAQLLDLELLAARLPARSAEMVGAG